MVRRNWLGRMLSPAIGLAAVLIGAGAASADGPPYYGPGPAELHAPVSMVAGEAPVILGESAGASALLTVYNSQGAVRDGVRALTPVTDLGIDFSSIAAIGADSGAAGPTSYAAQSQGASAPAVTATARDSTGAPPASSPSAAAPEVASPAPPALDIELPQPVPGPTNGALLNPLPIAFEAAIERFVLHDDAINPLRARRLAQSSGRDRGLLRCARI